MNCECGRTGRGSPRSPGQSNSASYQWPSISRMWKRLASSVAHILLSKVFLPTQLQYRRPKGLISLCGHIVCVRTCPTGHMGKKALGVSI